MCTGGAARQAADRAVGLVAVGDLDPDGEAAVEELDRSPDEQARVVRRSAGTGLTGGIAASTDDVQSLYGVQKALPRGGMASRGADVTASQITFQRISTSRIGQQPDGIAQAQERQERHVSEEDGDHARVQRHEGA